jgi:hypothetical protein
MNSDIFQEWSHMILPKMNPVSVDFVNNVPHHARQIMEHAGFSQVKLEVAVLLTLNFSY